MAVGDLQPVEGLWLLHWGRGGQQRRKASSGGRARPTFLRQNRSHVWAQS